MKKNSPERYQSLMFLLLATALVAGCSDATPSSATGPSAAGKKFLTENPPDGVRSVKEIRDELQAADASETVAAVVRGRINAGELPPFEEGKAAFALTDATGHDGDDDHDPHTCPFCSRSIGDYIGQISFYGDDSNLIATDARELFGVKEKSMVVVSGEARIGDDGMLQIRAEKIHVE